MGQKKSVKQVAKMLAYTLGRRPDEFGLVPDAEGFVKIKTLLKALKEEPGWGFLRRSYLDEILAVFPEPVIEIRDDRIRAVERANLAEAAPAADAPPVLFTCIRQRAYPHALEKGVRAADTEPVLLSASKEMAIRIGKRLDPDPVLLTVSTPEARKRGSLFFKAGGTLYSTREIPAGAFTGPPLPKEKPGAPAKPKKAPDSRKSAGSFILDLAVKKEAPKSRGKSKKEKAPSWKRDRKRLRREKEKLPF